MKTYNYLIVLFLISTLSFANVNQTEKDALIAIYNATNGQNWNSTWDLSQPEDTWYGVTIENHKIVELNLQFNNLQGSIPQELGNLVNLRKINFGFNHDIPRNLPLVTKSIWVVRIRFQIKSKKRILKQSAFFESTIS